ncbi:quinol monooxygenase YgiN [Leucobacter luti]|uniref:Quinol monooxygenase YgiN n=1 Tax=Leucobacter luti TaxID=340320 RepID=A0A4R6S7Y8_9MICO|nr:putative quinol monooxygenase [Leucobacter luti]TDP95504.1 quinol monooxygenase YgiN [Leucobacter luti]
MLRVLVPCRFTRENREAALTVYRALIAETRTEPGCVSYELLADVEDDTAFVLAESWRSQEDLDAHTRTPHFRRAMIALETLETAENARRFHVVDTA